MVHFNELYITDDGMNLVIDAEIDDLSMYDNCYIDRVTVTLKENCDKTDTKSEVIYEDDGNKLRHIRLCIPSLEHPLDFVTGKLSGSLFLVTVEAGYEGNGAEFSMPGCECGWDNAVIRGLAYDTKPIYDAAVRYASSYGNTCADNDARAFEDFILRYYSFDFAMRCGDIDTACMYFKNYLMNAGTATGISSGKPCGCHGRE